MADDNISPQHHHQRRGSDHVNPIKAPKWRLEIRLVFPPYLKDDITERPAKSREYTLEVCGKTFKGKTDAKGVLRQALPCLANSGKLTVHGMKDGKKTNFWEFNLVIGDLAPPEDTKGAQARLNNLGLFASTDLNDQSDERFLRAVDRFVTLFGVADPKPDFFPAGPKMKEVHGS
jgi:hypothetical protein